MADEELPPDPGAQYPVVPTTPVLWFATGRMRTRASGAARVITVPQDQVVPPAFVEEEILRVAPELTQAVADRRLARRQGALPPAKQVARFRPPQAEDGGRGGRP